MICRMLLNARLSCPLVLVFVVLPSRIKTSSLKPPYYSSPAFCSQKRLYPHFSYTVSTYLIYDFDVNDGGTHNRYQDVLEAEVIEIKRGCVLLCLYFTSGSPASGVAQASGEKCRGRPYAC